MSAPRFSGAAAALLALALIGRGADATAQGALKLDNYTFDKMVAVPGLTLLAKVDQSYAYGEKEDAFKELCKLAHTVPNFLIGEVPVQEYGDKENDDLRERFKLAKEDFPAFFLFKGQDSKVKFEGFADPLAKKPANWDDDEDGTWEPPMRKDVTAENLVMWLRKNGVKMPSIGTIADLDEIAKKFMKEGLQQSHIDEATKLAETEHKNDKKAPIYLKIMAKIKEKGADYVEKETARLTKLMAGKLTEEKKAELSEKNKILAVFAEKD